MMCETEITYRHYRRPQHLNSDRGVPKETRPRFEDLSLAPLFGGRKPARNGGITICVLSVRENGVVVHEARGVSYCSHEDEFSFETGKKIARERAMKYFDDTKVSSVIIKGARRHFEITEKKLYEKATESNLITQKSTTKRKKVNAGGYNLDHKLFYWDWVPE